jgi:PAS domain S-box-containing protein
LTEFMLVAPMGGLVVLVFLYLRRLSDGAAATCWGSAWLALYLAGTISTVEAPPRALLLLQPVLGCLFPGLVLAGCLAFYRGRFAVWPIAAGGAIGFGRVALELAGHPDLSLLLAIPVELPITLGAAGIAWRAAFERPRSLPEQLLGPTLVLLALVNAVDPLARLFQVPMKPMLLAWTGTALMTAMLQVGAFVERARDRERRMTAERDLLYRVARLAASEPRDARVALEGIVSAVAALASLDGFGVWLLDAEGRQLEVVARLRRIDEMPDSLVRIPVDDPVVRQAFASPEPVTVLDLRREGEALRRRADRYEIGETAVAPLRTGGRTLGAMFAALGPAKRFDAADAQLLAMLAQEIAGVVGHGRALGERAREAAALDAERRMLRALVEAVPAGIVLIDRDGRITTLSRLGAEQLALGEAERWVGRSVREAFAHYEPLLAPGEARRLLARFAWDPGDVESFEVRFARPAERVLDLSLREVRSEDGERLGQLWVTRDVTETRRLDERLARARRMELLGTLAGGVAHDFNDQLTAILGNARELLEVAGATDPGRPALEDLERAAEHCAQLTRSLLDLARPAPPAKRPVDLEEALREVAALLRPTLPRDVRLEIASAPSARAALADPLQLRRALLNLAANARDAVGARGTISLRACGAEPAAGERPRVVLEVRDDGCGMDARTLEQVFDPFFTTKPPGKGTGLGLAVVHAIVEAHGAALEVQSAPGSGTAFRLHWPAAGAPAAARVPDAGAGATVLLAEDDPSVRRLARLTLERRGYRVLEAEDGEAAVALFERHRADVALAVLDLSMPRRDGLSTLEALRAMAPELPAVVMTGRVEPLLDEATRPARVGVLAKPFGPDELAERVSSALASAAA